MNIQCYHRGVARGYSGTILIHCAHRLSDEEGNRKYQLGGSHNDLDFADDIALLERQYQERRNS